MNYTYNCLTTELYKEKHHSMVLAFHLGNVFAFLATVAFLIAIRSSNWCQTEIDSGDGNEKKYGIIQEGIFENCTIIHKWTNSSTLLYELQRNTSSTGLTNCQPLRQFEDIKKWKANINDKKIILMVIASVTAFLGVFTCILSLFAGCTRRGILSQRMIEIIIFFCFSSFVLTTTTFSLFAAESRKTVGSFKWGFFLCVAAAGAYLIAFSSYFICRANCSRTQRED
ncbi:hypothetical protein SNEBB_001391 [Seison nebaliae]|nr:hypothetical protein SNEBB_001391 [Seison nebaliae]